MKKAQLLTLAAAVLMTASCSDSKNDEPTDKAVKIAGTYSGYTIARSSYFSDMAAAGQKVTLSAVSADKVSLSFVSSTWGTVSIPEMMVVENDGVYMLNGTGTSAMAMQGAAAKEYTCNATGRIADGLSTFSFSCPQIMGGLTIEFCQGDIPADVVVPGTYKGYTKADCEYFHDMYADNQSVLIEKSADGTFTAKFTSDTWGDFTVSGITASLDSDGDEFELTGNGTTAMGMGGSTLEYTCSFEGDIDVEKKYPEFTFTVPAVMGGLTIEFHTGNMPEQSAAQ